MEDAPHTGFTAGRRRQMMINLLLGGAALAAALVMINYLATGHFKRCHWNNLSSFQLSPFSESVLGRLTNDVTISVFFNQENQGDVYTMVRGLLKEYQDANPRRIRVALVDEDRNYGEARALLDRLHLSGAGRRNFVAMESPGHSPAIFPEGQLAHLNASNLKNIRRDAFNGESLFTRYLSNLTAPQNKKVYFLQGHGERDPGDPYGQRAVSTRGGLTNLATMVREEAGCDWGLLSLGGTNQIPADCQLLIIASPEHLEASCSSNELTKIEDYLATGNGRLLALLNVDMGLNALLRKWDLRVDTNVVEELDPAYRVGPGEFVAGRYNAESKIAAPLIAQRLPLHMLSPHPVLTTRNSTNSHPGAPEIGYIVFSSTNSVAGVQRGAFPLIASVEQGVINNRDGTRLLVVGDADFLDDQWIEQPPGANRYFASQALEWLLQRPNFGLSDVLPRAIQEYKISMTQGEMAQAHWLFLLAMPGTVLLLGGLVWLRRRS